VKNGKRGCKRPRWREASLWAGEGWSGGGVRVWWGGGGFFWFFVGVGVVDGWGVAKKVGGWCLWTREKGVVVTGDGERRSEERKKDKIMSAKKLRFVLLGGGEGVVLGGGGMTSGVM